MTKRSGIRDNFKSFGRFFWRFLTPVEGIEKKKVEKKKFLKEKLFLWKKKNWKNFYIKFSGQIIIFFFKKKVESPSWIFWEFKKNYSKKFWFEKKNHKEKINLKKSLSRFFWYLKSQAKIFCWENFVNSFFTLIFPSKKSFWKEGSWLEATWYDLTLNIISMNVYELELSLLFFVSWAGSLWFRKDPKYTLPVQEHFHLETIGKERSKSIQFKIVIVFKFQSVFLFERTNLNDLMAYLVPQSTFWIQG